MNAVTLPTHSGSHWRDAATFVRQALAATTRRDWLVVLALGAVITMITLPQRLDMLQKFPSHPVPVLVELTLPLLSSVVMFLGWMLAWTGSDAWRPLRTRLIYALLGAGAIATLLVVTLWHQFGPAELWIEMAAARGKTVKTGWLMVVAEYINMLIIGGMVYAVAFVVSQRAETQRAFQATVRQRSSLEHQVLQSRLAAMQAQVEPRFLFDTLVDIEVLYRRDAASAAANLDRLICYLRAALPRLREAGTTVDAELDLVRAYLDIVKSLHGGRPQLQVELEQACRSSRFYPMLLLPLVQRAVRHPSGVQPERIGISVRRDGAEHVISLKVTATGGCADDPELARVRERLAGLYGNAARLDCVEADGSTEMTMRIPAGGAAAAR